jgi:predicted DNA-binding transcriptional regulator AlpA
LAARLQCHPATIWRKAKHEAAFPKPVQIGGMTRWVEAEVDDYLAAIEASRSKSTK